MLDNMTDEQRAELAREGQRQYQRDYYRRNREKRKKWNQDYYARLAERKVEQHGAKE